jgi:hypothetical protein
MVDPSIRIQNIAIEAAELQARRQMCWSEIANRATMFMTIVGATVFGLALIGNATDFDSTFLLISLLILPVLVFAGISSLARMGELERHDGELVQGLNRLRHLRVELDPGIEPYLITSPYDDVESMLAAYGKVNPRLHSLWVLETLVGVVVALAAGVFVAITAALAGLGGASATLAGVVTFIGFMLLFALIGYRSFSGQLRSVKALFPAPRPTANPPSDQSRTVP